METENLESIIQKATGICISRTEKVYSNEVFTELCERVKNHVRRRRELQNVVHVHVGEMNSIIQRPTEVVLKKQESLDFLFCDGSVIRFSSFGEMEIELTRVKVPAVNRGKGLGGYIMTLALGIISKSLGFEPTIWLECTGAIGAGDTYEEYPIEKQISFFERFNFSVESQESDMAYAQMVRYGEVGGVPLSYPPSLTLNGA